jgi:hypothetical protein
MSPRSNVAASGLSSRLSRLVFQIYIYFSSAVVILRRPYLSLFAWYLLGFWLAFSRTILKRGAERQGIGMAAPIDTVMMKYRRHGPDEREERAGWPGVLSNSTALGVCCLQQEV